MSIAQLSSAQWLNINVNSVSCESLIGIQDMDLQNLTVETGCSLNCPVNMSDDVIIQNGLQIGNTGSGNYYTLPSEKGNNGQFLTLNNNNLIWTSGDPSEITIQQGNGIIITEPTQNSYNVALNSNLLSSVESSDNTISITYDAQNSKTNFKSNVVQNSVSAGNNIGVMHSMNNYVVSLMPNITNILESSDNTVNISYDQTNNKVDLKAIGGGSVNIQGSEFIDVSENSCNHNDPNSINCIETSILILHKN